MRRFTFKRKHAAEFTQKSRGLQDLEAVIHLKYNKQKFRVLNTARRTCGALALLFVSLFKGSAYKNTQSEDCHMAGKKKPDGRRSEVVMRRAEHYFHKHTQGT